MIRVDRLRQDPGSPIQPSDAWFDSASEATSKAEAEGPAHRFSNLYRTPQVRMALEELFHDKCAYCESRATPGSAWDVEHFRPKAGVMERPDHPGYFWLAYTWMNLYSACEFCNRRRKDSPRWGDPKVLPVAGKGTRFPLQDEAKRAMSPDDDFNEEQPLLLDPCAQDDDPEEHLAYDPQGQIHPREAGDKRAEATISICHLNRRRLRDDRARILVRVVELCRVYRIALTKRSDEIARGLERLLADHVADDALYAGVARAVIRDPAAFL